MKQDSKVHILATATAVFAAKGFAKASMNDIVQATGLSKGGVYWHFKSKDDIVAGVFDQFCAGHLQLMTHILAGDGSASDKILRLAASSGNDLMDMAVALPSPLEFYALAARDERLLQILQSYTSTYQSRLEALIQQGVDEGAFHNVDAADAAITLGALFEGMFMLWAIQPDNMDIHRQMETAVSHLLNGLYKEDHTSRGVNITNG